jgi:predicted DNA-binding transcriptional regulator YafY
VRADRLVSLVLLLQARGCVTGRALAAELGVSVRTVYRDLEALGAAGVPVITESGPGGGCRLMDGYRFPLRGLRADEAEALLILGVPAALRDLGLDRALSAAHRQIQVTSGAPPGALVHLDMPRWFGSREEVPCLRDLAAALRLGRKLRLTYQHADGRADEPRAVGPLGLVNKAGTWYLVALADDARGEGAQAGDGGREVAQVSDSREGTQAGEVRGGPRVFRVGRIGGAVILAEPFARPPGFGLAEFWARWSAEFEASRPRIAVTLRASPGAQAAFAEVFGDAADPALASAPSPGADGWRVVTLPFEHEVAAAYRLAGFGDQVEVLSPLSVRDRLVRTARQILTRYAEAAGSG